MFQLRLAEVIQADREREIAELIRQRRLLKPEPEAPAANATDAGASDARAPRARARAAGS